MKNNIIKNYLDTQKNFFEDTHHLMVPNNHYVHNQDPEYWDILLKEIKSEPKKWENKRALDFGCGCGRNLVNLSTLANWETIDGCDISKQNAEYSKKWFEENKGFSKSLAKTWENNGIDIQPTEENYYDFIMSHIVFQHISNYDVRYAIIKDMYKSIKPNGLVSLHFMDLEVGTSYHDKCIEFKNCRVDNPEFLIKDFEKIGFKNVTCEVGSDYFTKLKSYYIKGTK